ncbi:hypothetical protein ACS5PJ_04925 [Pseudarthrobacter sp. YS3]|uniref:hypothetical protein n=1 Tax=Pseudarthrobacter sp. YS3 TaxID=3453718 RepID=UPI003EECD627
MTKLKPYPEYKDSGVDWLGYVPSHWAVRPLGNCFDERRETVSDKEFTPLSVTMSGIVPQLETAAKTDNGDNRKRVNAGDFVINSRSDRKGSAGVSELEGSVSVISTVLAPRAGIDQRFVHHLLRCQPFQEEYYRFGTGIVADLWSTRYSSMKRITLALPTAAEQTGIAAFLDHEVAQIDDLIGKQEQLRGLLAEKRQAIITHAVTKGLDPAAPTKPSGIPWLDQIPVHWTDSRLKFVLKRIEQGVSPQADGVPASGSCWGVLKSGCVNGGVFRETENKQLPSDFTIDPAIAVKVGDLVVSRASGSPKLVGSAARVRSLDSRLILSDKTFRFVPAPEIDADFLEWFLNSQLYREQVVGSISGAEGLANNISSTALSNIQLPLPAYTEQLRIGALLRRETTALAHLEGKATKAVELLRERRSAIISAAVTGKIDVREGVA